MHTGHLVLFWSDLFLDHNTLIMCHSTRLCGTLRHIATHCNTHIFSSWNDRFLDYLDPATQCNALQLIAAHTHSSLETSYFLIILTIRWSCCTWEWTTPHVCRNNVPHVNRSKRRFSELILYESYLHMNQSCPTHAGVMFHVWIGKWDNLLITPCHVSMSSHPVSRMNESCPTCEWSMICFSE